MNTFTKGSNGNGGSANGTVIFVDFDPISESLTQESKNKVLTQINKIKNGDNSKDGRVILFSPSTPPALAELFNKDEVSKYISGVISLLGSPTSHFSVLMGEKNKVTLNGINVKLQGNKLISNNNEVKEFDEITIDSKSKSI